MSDLPPLETGVTGIRSRFVEDINGLRMHVLEAGTAGRPCLLLLHGFPELAYSWRKVMPALAAAGYHVVAPDQRGYGRTTGWSADYDGDLAPFRMLNLARDAVGLLAALGLRSVEAVVGHDFGASVAAWCALVRPDIFRRVALMSAPFAGVPPLPLGPQKPVPKPDIHAALATLPRPRKHYQWYYSTRPANAEMQQAPQGLHAFLRAYYHVKSADWAPNAPHRLPGWTAEALAELPGYYIMDLGLDMAAQVAPDMPDAAAIAANAWLPEAELAVYAGEYARTGFQGGLQWYRCRTSGLFEAETQLFAGRSIDVPAVFVSGASDWGVYQTPGAVERMRDEACSRMLGCHLIPGAGHWVQQEQPAEVTRRLLEFLAASPGA
ncbi:alpha/beta hydrolase [Paeniroseomonas aquatica]|uniref:Alpha/beta hydrolase n=1 Tax=Paeniroseomonas aquatica TaxID=373043 RepID=A0ABT8A209_9PROT|nr:alpha/beta hydrolase [Paeniroseomonas aquatica]MDN3563785.1 alpha/beta hydrolase [Paeniroseomonas aquatica]